MVLGRLRHNSMRSTDYTKTFPTLDGYSFHQTHADTHRDTRRHTHSHKGAWRLPQVPRSRRDPGGRARRSAAASVRRSASDPHSPQPRCTAAASTFQDILAPEDGGRWRWCCGLVDSVALGERSHQAVTVGEPNPCRRGCGGSTGVRNGIVAGRGAEPPARLRAVMAMFREIILPQLTNSYL